MDIDLLILVVYDTEFCYFFFRNILVLLRCRVTEMPGEIRT